MERVYLDWNATTPPCPEAMDAHREASERFWGNSSSLHREGRGAGEIVEGTCQALAEWTRSRPSEWILTSGGTESIHTAILGCLQARGKRGRVVSSRGEHASTEGVLERLEADGWEVVRLPLRADGTWDPHEVERACLEAPTALASLIWANNETGAVSDAGTLARRLAEAKIPLHLDSVQCFGKMDVDLTEVPAAFVSLSGHKFQSTKGSGALRIRRGAPWSRWIQGGNQQRSRRGGTVDVAGAAAMHAAILRSRKSGVLEPDPRDGLQESLVCAIPGLQVVSRDANRLSNTLCLIVEGADSSALLARMDERGFSIASGSACSTGSPDPSQVLLAMGIPEWQAHCAVRISLGPGTTRAHLDAFAKVFAQEVEFVRRVGGGLVV
ncbi:MAG TPA: aminotransferase class V-fold PLP-dependent enzyme [Fibrobacteria bacterium]|nr:aminotransferase class V-fold PLP-dependent enzyme [Fibrobacteria bacterium]HOX52447.1 aminotransferase class V-fold PLP-dependent enzyme [Fibrobacteria bacterium]